MDRSRIEGFNPGLPPPMSTPSAPTAPIAVAIPDDNLFVRRAGQNHTLKRRDSPTVVTGEDDDAAAERSTGDSTERSTERRTEGNAERSSPVRDEGGPVFTATTFFSDGDDDAEDDAPDDDAFADVGAAPCEYEAVPHRRVSSGSPICRDGGRGTTRSVNSAHDASNNDYGPRCVSIAGASRAGGQIDAKNNMADTDLRVPCGFSNGAPTSVSGSLPLLTKRRIGSTARGTAQGTSRRGASRGTGGHVGGQEGGQESPRAVPVGSKFSRLFSQDPTDHSPPEDGHGARLRPPRKSTSEEEPCPPPHTLRTKAAGGAHYAHSDRMRTSSSSMPALPLHVHRALISCKWYLCLGALLAAVAVHWQYPSLGADILTFGPSEEWVKKWIQRQVDVNLGYLATIAIASMLLKLAHYSSYLDEWLHSSEDRRIIVELVYHPRSGPRQGAAQQGGGPLDQGADTFDESSVSRFTPREIDGGGLRGGMGLGRKFSDMSHASSPTQSTLSVSVSGEINETKEDGKEGEEGSTRNRPFADREERSTAIGNTGAVSADKLSPLRRSQSGVKKYLGLLKRVVIYRAPIDELVQKGDVQKRDMWRRLKKAAQKDRVIRTTDGEGQLLHEESTDIITPESMGEDGEVYKSLIRCLSLDIQERMYVFLNAPLVPSRPPPSPPPCATLYPAL